MSRALNEGSIVIKMSGFGRAEPTDEPPPAVALPSRDLDPLIRVTLALFVIGLGVWLLLSGSAYRRQYSATGAAWHRGAQNFIEITLLREDDINLACAADATIQGLHCGFGADRRPWRPFTARAAVTREDDAHLLRPYNTVSGELLLGAGLWDSLARRGPLPSGRFTVTCDFDIAGALRSVALRWTRGGNFEGPDRSLAAGVLSNCAIPP